MISVDQFGSGKTHPAPMVFATGFKVVALTLIAPMMGTAHIRVIFKVTSF